MENELLREYLNETRKTAIAWVQEICQKKHCLLPRYVDKDLRSHVSAAPRFEVTVTIDFKGQEYSARGISSKKQDAKEEAAIQLLLGMNITPKDLATLQERKYRAPFREDSQNRTPFREVSQNRTPFREASQNRTPSREFSQNLDRTDVDPATPASKLDVIVPTSAATSGQCYVDLILFCEKRGIPDPEYEDVQYEGPASCKTFRILCRARPVNCQPIEVIGESDNRKKARRVAAAMMLRKLQDFATGENSINSIQIVSTQNTGPRVSSRNEPGCADESLLDAHYRFKEMSGPTILSLRDKDIFAMTSVPMDILASIAEEDNLMVIYSHVPEQETNGLSKWFCEIVDLEEAHGQPSTFMGEGDDEMNAQTAAAINALIFLQEASIAGTDDISGSSTQDLF